MGLNPLHKGGPSGQSKTLFVHPAELSLNPLHKGGPSGPYAPILPHFEPELQVPIPNPLTHESNFDDSEGGSESFWRGAASTSRAKAHGQTIRRTTKWSTAASQTESLGLSEVPKRTRTCAVGVT